jgi:hypothetical protein
MSQYIHIAYAPGLTIENFRSVSAKHEPPQEIDGLLAWAAGEDDKGLHVVTVWESKAHNERFAAEKLFPAFQEVGISPLSVNSIVTTMFDAGEFYVRSQGNS